jgi:hypothetical protein
MLAPKRKLTEPLVDEREGRLKFILASGHRAEDRRPGVSSPSWSLTVAWGGLGGRGAWTSFRR